MLLYAILRVKFDITSVRTKMGNHPRQSKMAGYIGGKRGCMGGKEWVQGRRGEAPTGGGGAESSHWLNKTFVLLGFVLFSAIQTQNSSKILEKKWK